MRRSSMTLSCLEAWLTVLPSQERYSVRAWIYAFVLRVQTSLNLFYTTNAVRSKHAVVVYSSSLDLRLLSLLSIINHDPVSPSFRRTIKHVREEYMLMLDSILP